MTDHIITTQQKVDPDKYGDNYDRIFRKKDKCPICGHEEHDDICEEILRQQRDRT